MSVVKPAPNTEKKRLPIIKRSSIVPANSSILETPRRRQDQIVNIPSEEHVLTERTLHAASIRNSNANNVKHVKIGALGKSSASVKKSLKSVKARGGNQENAYLSER